jgi:hypothetical protein
MKNRTRFSHDRYEVFARAMRWLSRGEVPVDGCMCREEPAEDPAPARDLAAEEAASFELSPVKWGNFR